jgi:hypothetical protein
MLKWCVAAVLVALPSIVFAQGTLTGTVRDASGGVLPGVTVEATSPSIPGEVRTVVTDGAGIYRIINLSPGTYSLKLTLSGFNIVQRDGIALSGGATLTIPIQMRVGDLQETITVTGETPVVDVQTVRREVVLDAEVIQTLPGTRTVGALLNATPGLEVTAGALNATPTMTFFAARGGPINEGRMTVNGLTVAAAFNGGGVSSYILDSVNADETSVTVAGGMGESDTGGPVMNIVPRSGGNAFRGQAFFNNAGDWSRGDNLDDELRAVGIEETPGIIKSYDASMMYSGPVKQDRLWFLGSVRQLNTETAVEGIVANANAGDLSRWDWVRDDSLPARQTQGRRMYIGRATAQVTDKHRINFSHEYQTRCEGAPLRGETDDGCHGHRRGSDWIASAGATTSPEAATSYIDFPYSLTQALWTAPVTNKILLEAGYSRLWYEHAGGPGQLPPDGLFDISVQEQSTALNPATGQPYAPRANYTYRALAQYSDNNSTPMHWRASASYVTGSHNMKVGYQGSFLVNNTRRVRNPNVFSYRFNRGVPNRFSVAIPEWQTADRTSVAALYVQDAWTRGRMTLQGALRYDRSSSYSPAGLNGTSATSIVNAAAIQFERTVSVDSFNDITPRFGLAYDVFGNGRTAVKFNMGHYLDAATNDGSYTRNNPANRTVSTYDRNWTDADNDRVVDCGILNFDANGECAALTGNSLNFGGLSGATTEVNPETLRGWGVRENDWQWGLTVQQELLPRVSVEVGYSRRWFQGFVVTDNINRDPSEYDSWTINAPGDPRLPGGGGYPITTYVPTDAAAAEPAENYITFEKDFGPQRTNYWHGVDVTLNTRLRQGLTFQFGTSTGRGVLDTCATSTRIDSPDPRNCRDVDPFRTTIRGLGSYTIPRVDVLVSATIRSEPPLELSAALPVPNSIVRQLLGRLPRGASPTGNTIINLHDNEHRIFADNRRTQIDMRLAKIFRFSSTRADVGVDIGNLLNTNYATGFEGTYQFGQPDGGTWADPTAVYTPRFVRLNFTVNF